MDEAVDEAVEKAVDQAVDEAVDRAVDQAVDGAADEQAAARERIEGILLGGPRRYSRADVTRLSGVSAERTQEIWRALGFAVTDEDEIVFTDGDLLALAGGERFIEAGLITADSETAMTRQLGHHLSRLAEWQVMTIWSWLEGISELEPGDEEFARLVEILLPELERLQTHVWRRHLAAYAGRTLTAPGERQEASLKAVGFTDMVAYTRMTRGLDDAQLDSVLGRFEALAGDVIADHGGRLVKTIGDEVLFTADTPDAAAEIALELTERAAADEVVPRLRTGLAYGTVLSRYGDVYGEVVNIAARLTSVARPGTVVASEELAERLARGGAYELRALRPVSVRGYSRLRSAVLRRAGRGGAV
ncbi:adenylate/guanylate cyclase domain-containing protein [Streptomyces polyrhachis]|uniref:Adenylate/guanylate cyclase domain-containing protein n=1 Tax=Streptomyces polyrhachis TaxID=1282885 RepID=A0ABW2GEI6_9ACTN